MNFVPKLCNIEQVQLTSIINTKCCRYTDTIIEISTRTFNRDFDSLLKEAKNHLDIFHTGPLRARARPGRPGGAREGCDVRARARSYFF